MPFDFFELFRGQVAALAQDLPGDAQLPNVQQHSHLPEVFQFHSGETQFATEGHEQYGYLQGMGVGGFIRLSQPRYELQRVGIADNTFDQILDNILDRLDLEAFSLAYVANYAFEDLGCARETFVGWAEFFLDRDDVVIGSGARATATS